MKRDSLFFRIKQGIQDTCYIMVEEIRNEFRDEGLLIFCVLVPLFYPCSIRGYTTTKWCATCLWR